MRVLFLEFDGVLHPASAAHRFTPGNSLRQGVLALWLFRWAWILDELLLPHPEVRIVAHSNWRLFASDEELKSVLGPLARRFVGTTPHGAKQPGFWQASPLFDLPTACSTDSAHSVCKCTVHQHILTCQGLCRTLNKWNALTSG
jgi:hypothetical protein